MSLKTSGEGLNGEKFTWAMLQSADPRVYAHRLFAADFPRYVVKSILAVELVDARNLEIAAIPPPPLWCNPEERRAACLRAYEQRVRITQKYDQLAKETLGMRCLEVIPDGDNFPLTDFLAQVLAGPLDMETLDDFGRIGYRISEQEDVLADLPPLSRYRAHLELSRWGEQALSQFVGDLHDFKKRTVALMLTFSSMLPDNEQAGFFLTAVELERLSDTVARELGFKDLDDDLEQLVEQKARAAVNTCLSTTRLHEFRRVKDDDFVRALQNAPGEVEVKRATAAAIYELKQQAEAAWMSLQQDAAIAPESRGALFNQVRKDCTRRAGEILGAQALQELHKLKPYWLLNPGKDAP